MLYVIGITTCNPRDLPDTNVVFHPDLPRISSRWAPGEIVRRDSAAGTFECVNCVDLSNDALRLQQTLFYDPPSRRRFSWLGSVPLFALIAGAALFVCLVAWKR